MRPVSQGILSAIGGTPLVRLERAIPDCRFRLFAKLEGLNPGGSMKDRAALSMIRHGIETGVIRQNTVVIESSSGNMGIGMAQACRYYGLKFICVVDPKITLQNERLIRAYGGTIEMVQQPDPVTGEFLSARLRRVKTLLAAYPTSFSPDQYSNLYNPIAHYETIREILESLDGELDFLFCATSTCGTLRGSVQYVRQQGLPTRVFAVDAVGSIIFFGGPVGKRLIPGHGASVRPQLFKPDLAEECILVSDRDCVIGCRLLAEREAILAGGSSGGIFMGVQRVAHLIPPDSNCVMILPDRGERYMETIYCDYWVASHFGSVEALSEEGAPACQAF